MLDLGFKGRLLHSHPDLLVARQCVELVVHRQS